MAQNRFNWVAYIGTIVITAGLTMWGVNLTESQPKAIDSTALATDIASQLNIPNAADVADVVAAKLATGEEVPADIQSQLTEIKDLVQDPDAIFSDTAELLAVDEVTNDERGIRDFLNDNGYDVEDKDDIDEIDVKDMEVTIKDKDDGDYDVGLKLRVEFYDATLNEDVKETVYADVEIRDGDVDDVDYYL
jgi:hypothetical protein